MLVISRKINESISIGDGIVITVTEIGKEKVRLGITADKSISILRDDAKVRRNESEKETSRSFADRPQAKK